MIWTFALVALVAFGVEGAIGFGSTVIAVSLGAQLVPIEVLLPSFLPISIAFSLTLLRGPIQWRTLLVEIAPLVAIGAAVGLVVARYAPSRELLIAFAIFIVALSILELANVPLRWAAPFLVLGGIVHGMFGTGGPMIVYVTRKKIADKTAFRATLAVLWVALNVVLLTSFTARARYPDPHLLAAMAMVVIPGRLLGERLHRALDAQRFARVVWVVLLLAGCALLARTL
jgi:uncharacterized membrane protein YfcA